MDGSRLSRWCLREIQWPLIGGSILLLLATAANVSAALLFQPLFDRGVLGEKGSILTSLISLQIALFLSRGILAGFAFDLFTRASAQIGQTLTLKLFDHLQVHSLSYFLDHPQARLLQLLRNDVVVLEINLGQTLGQAIIATLQTILTLAVMALWEPRLALLCVVGLGVGAALIWLASRLTNRALASEIEANEFVAEHLLLTLSLRGFFLRTSASFDWGRTRLQQLL
ncbi:MAG: ABC transporter transmembrane domain-containing protein, partial [Pseudolabrys sp.]